MRPNKLPSHLERLEEIERAHQARMREQLNPQETIQHLRDENRLLGEALTGQNEGDRSWHKQIPKDRNYPASSGYHCVGLTTPERWILRLTVLLIPLGLAATVLGLVLLGPHGLWLLCWPGALILISLSTVHSAALHRAHDPGCDLAPRTPISGGRQ